MQTTNADAGQAAGTPGNHQAAVQSQLAKVLGSPHFRNSKRSQTLLRYVVEAVLAGDQNSLKERCVGAAVFGRDSDYDTAQDPVVRNAAIEVRKRLAQYYLEPEHASDLRIELPIGSYVPTFTVEAPIADPEPEQVAAPRRSLSRKWIAAVLTIIVLTAAAAYLWASRRSPAAELDAFWEPLFRERKAVQICVGQPTRLYRFVGPRIEELNHLLGQPGSTDRNTKNLSIGAGEVLWVAPEYVFLRDALSAFNVASWIQSRGRTYQLTSVSETNYSRLRHAPLVAIGAFNNPWALRVTADLPFVFDSRVVDGVTYHYISDRRHPEAMNWRVVQPVGAAMTEDYAIVTRVFDPATENTVVSAAGIEAYGTLAAGEFVTQPGYLGAALRAAPADWRHRNLQFVLGTKIIDGTPGPPHVLDKQFW